MRDDEREPHPIWWKLIHGFHNFGLSAQALKAAERPPKFTVLTIPQVPDFDGRPVQLCGKDKRRKEVTITVTGDYPIVILRSATADVNDGFTVRSGKLKLKCRDAIWATCTVPFGSSAHVLESTYAGGHE